MILGVFSVCGLGLIGMAPLSAQDLSELPPELAAQIRADQAQEKAQDDEASSSEAPAKPEERETWEEMVDRWTTPMPVPKASVTKIDDTYAYPHPAIPIKMKIVGEDEEHYWLVGLPPEDPGSPLHNMWIRRQENEVLLRMKREFDREIGPGRFLDFSQPVVPPPTASAIRFESAGEGLPMGGKWQMGFDVVDLNGDGHLDLVMPPQRLGQPAVPTVFLGDGDGDFRLHRELRWPRDVPFDYGDVKTADFDGDGHLDLVIAIHFRGQYVMYGSEDGTFGRSQKLPSPDPRMTSRATTIADFDGDGRADVAFLAELDMDMNQNKRFEDVTTVWIVRNTPKGWRLASYPGLPKFVIGDGIRAADVDRDGKMDLAIASTTSAWRALVLLNRLPEGFKAWDESDILGGSFHFGVKPSISGDDSATNKIYSAFQQYFSTPKGKLTRTGVAVYAPREGGNDWQNVQSKIAFMDDQRYNYYFRLAVGDLDGDGLEDVVASRRKGGIEAWIQKPGGVFYKNEGSELDAAGRVYDLRIVDLDGDGRGDVIASIADLEQEPGGVRVWMSRPRT